MKKRDFLKSALTAAVTGSVGYFVASKYELSPEDRAAAAEQYGLSVEEVRKLEKTAKPKASLQAGIVAGFVGAVLSPWVFKDSFNGPGPSP